MSQDKTLLLAQDKIDDECLSVSYDKLLKIELRLPKLKKCQNW